MKKYLPLLAAALTLTGDGRVLVTDGYVQRAVTRQMPTA